MKVLFLALILAVIAYVHAGVHIELDPPMTFVEDQAFNDFKAKYKKTYKNLVEEERRKEIFLANYRRLHKEDGKLGFHRISDLTQTEKELNVSFDLSIRK